VPVDEVSSGSWCNGSSASSWSPATSEGSRLAAITASKQDSTKWSWRKPFPNSQPTVTGIDMVQQKTESRQPAALAEGVERRDEDLPLNAAHHPRQNEKHGRDDADVLAPAGGSMTVGMFGDECCWCCGGDWGASHVPKMPPLSASQRLTREAIVQVNTHHQQGSCCSSLCCFLQTDEFRQLPLHCSGCTVIWQGKVLLCSVSMLGLEMKTHHISVVMSNKRTSRRPLRCQGAQPACMLNNKLLLAEKKKACSSSCFLQAALVQV
jgi:hypothetical protein